MKNMPILKFPKLMSLTMDQNPIESLEGLSHSNLENLEDFYMYNYTDLKNRKLPVLNIPKLRTLNI